MLEKGLGLDSLLTITVEQSLAVLYKTHHDFAAAEALFQRALSSRERIESADSPDIATAAGLLAQTYWSHGNYEAAEATHLVYRSLSFRMFSLPRRSLRHRRHCRIPRVPHHGAGRLGARLIAGTDGAVIEPRWRRRWEQGNGRRFRSQALVIARAAERDVGIDGDWFRQRAGDVLLVRAGERARSVRVQRDRDLPVDICWEVRVGRGERRSRKFHR
ncbi:MAG: tetratricopeptide repeat protein [Myxococcales bacterium]|nr:tetratricopeptide repeat protein [Myxococcales bacterium]